MSSVTAERKIHELACIADDLASLVHDEKSRAVILQQAESVKDANRRLSDVLANAEEAR